MDNGRDEEVLAVVVGLGARGGGSVVKHVFDGERVEFVLDGQALDTARDN